MQHLICLYYVFFREDTGMTDRQDVSDWKFETLKSTPNAPVHIEPPIQKQPRSESLNSLVFPLIKEVS